MHFMDTLASLQAAIREQIDCSPGGSFGVVDFDNTCIVNDVAEATLAYMCRNCMLKCGELLPFGTQHRNKKYHEQVLRHYYGLLNQGDITSASLLCAGIFAGFRPNEAEAVVSAAMDAETNISGRAELYGVSIAVGLGVRTIVRKLIDFSMANNVQIWIVSASPEIAVQTAMRRFRIPGNLIALRSRIDKMVLSKELDKPQSIREGKVECIKTFVDPDRRPLFGIGDSIYDLPMLEYANIRAVVDRDNALTKEARLRGWFILES
jgi:phosphoserine phosphatase